MIRWEDPPPDRFRWKRTAAELAQNPGRWGRVLEPTTKRESTNCTVALQKHGCEVTTRTVDNEGIAVWARWPTESHTCSGMMGAQKSGGRVAQTTGPQAIPDSTGDDMRDSTRTVSAV